MTAQLEHVDADTVLDRWLTDRLDFDLPCDINPEHEPADWIRKTRVCTCSLLMCDACRANHVTKAPKVSWPRYCLGCSTVVSGPELIFFVPLREAPVS